MNASVKEAAERFWRQMPDAPIDLDIQLPTEDLRVTGDRVMVQDAVLNLMTNAVVHGRSDLTTVRVSLAREDLDVNLRVTDDGIEIPKEKRVPAISRFGQAKDGQGSGLGLAIAARVMINHASALRIEDCPTGTSILLSFPADPF